MSVHWQRPNVTTKNRTITHSRAYCHCPDGGSCSVASNRSDPKKESRAMRRVKVRLTRRQKGFDAGGGKGKKVDTLVGWRKPGSNKK